MSISSAAPAPPGLAWHRRIGLSSLALVLLGGGWIALSVLPGLQRADKAGGNKSAGASGAKPDAKASAAALPVAAPVIGSVKVTFVNAPVGFALLTMLWSANFNPMTDPSVSGNVSYATPDEMPFWDAIGRVIGANSPPDPGVQVVQSPEATHILRRDADVMAMRFGGNPFTQAAPLPQNLALTTPLPIGDGKTRYRMAGYVELKPNDGHRPPPAALLEIRIPGEQPHWIPLRGGEPLSRYDRSMRGTSYEESDVMPQVQSIEPTRLVLKAGSKSLVVPLGKVAVVDIFGVTAIAKPGLPAPAGSPVRRILRNQIQ